MIHSPSPDNSRLWKRRLIDPSPHVTGREQQRQARLIATLLLSLFILGTCAALVNEASRPAEDIFKNDEFYVTGTVLSLLVPLYILSRTRHYHRATTGLIVLASLGIFAIAVMASGRETDTDFFAYLALPVLLSSFLLNLRTTTILVGTQLAGLLVFGYVFDLSGGWDMIGFLVMLSTVILYGTHYRNLLEYDRQRDLRDAETRYRELVERAPFIIAIQHKGEITYINPAGVRILGGTDAADFIGQPTLRFVHPSDAEAAHQRIARTHDMNRDAVQVEERLIGLDDRIVDVETTVLPFTVRGEPAAQIIARDLTEQRRAETEQRASETQYRNLIENLPLGIVRTTASVPGRFVLANPAYLALLRVSEAELRTMRLSDLFFDPAELQLLSEQLLAEGSFEDRAVQIKRRDGTPVWVLFTTWVVRDESGRVIYFDSVVEDITLRQEAAAAVLRGETHLQALLNAIPDLIFQIDRRGIFTSYHAPEDKLLLQPGSFLGKSIQELLPDLADQAFENIERALTTNTLQTYEYQMEVQGAVYYYEARMSPCAEDEVVVVVRDITEWKHLMAGLRRERDLVARITETSPVAITTVNTEGRITFANQRAETLLGLTQDKITQRTYNAPDWHITDYEGHPLPDNQLPFGRVLRTRKPVYNVAHAIEWPDGRRVLLSISGAPLTNASGDIEDIVFSIEDVTERIRAEQTLREREERYRSLFDNAMTGFALHEIITDAIGRPVDYRFLEVNRRFEQLTGLRAEDVVGRCVTDVLPTIEGAFIERYGRVALTGEAIRFESYTEPLKRYFDIAAFSPRAGLFATLFLDITERIKAQADLRDSEQRYRSLFNGIDDTIMVHDLAGRILDVNEAACRRLEYSRAELLRMTLADIDEPGAFADGFGNRLQQQLTVGKMSGIRGIHIAKSGRRIAADVNTKVITYQGQQAVLGVTRDVTERNRVEALLRIQRDLVVALAEISDMSAALEQVVECVQQIDEVDASAVLLVDRDSGALSLVHQRGLSPDYAAYATYFAPDSPQAQIAQTGEPIFCPYRELLPDLKDEVRLRENLGAFGVLPIQHDRYTVAVLVAASRGQDQFSEYVQNSLSAIAAQVGAFLVRILTETALRRSEATMQSVLRTAPVGLGLVTNRIMGWTNDQFQHITGYSADELMNMNALQLYESQTEYDRVGQHKYGQLNQGKSVGTVETQFKRKDGTLVDILLSSSPIDPADFSLGLVTSVLDMTESKRAQHELAESEARYSTLINASPMAIMVMREGYYVFANPAGARYLGYDHPDDVIGLTVINTIAPASQELIRARMNRLAQGMANPPTEIEILRPDGSILLVESRSMPVTLQGAPATFIISQDISERKAVQAAEREARALSDALRDTAASLTQTLDREEIFERILDNIGRVLPHDAATIMLVDDHNAIIMRTRGFESFGSDNIGPAFRMPIEDYPMLVDLFATRQVQIVSDTHTDPRWRPIPNTDWIRSHITAPILMNDTITGMINLDSTTPNAFTTEHAERVAIFAGQAAVAIQNASLFAEVQQYAAQLEALHQITLDVTAQVDLNILLNKLVEHAIKLVDAEAGGIYLYRPEQDVLEWAVQAGDPAAMAPLGSQLQRGEGLAGQVWETRDVMIVDHYSQWAGRSPQYEGLSFTAVIGVPITWDKQLLGVFNATADRGKRTFSERDAQLLRLFVSQAAIALQRARMFDDLEKRVRERTIDLTVRNKVAATLSHSLDQAVILHDVLETIVDQLAISGGAIFLLADANALELAAAYHISAETLDWITHILPAASAHGTFSTIDMPYNGSLAAVLRVPIWHQDQIEGLIILISDHTRPWRSADTRMLDAIGRQIAVAMHNARLFAQVVRDEARLRTILQSVADGLLVFNPNGELLLINPAAEALFSFYQDEPGSESQAARQLWLWLHAQGRPQTVEFVLPTVPLQAAGNILWLDQCIDERCRFMPDDGDLAWPCWLTANGPDAEHLHHCTLYKQVPNRSLQAHSADVRDTDGHVLGEVIALRDVTYFRELDELKGNFVSTVSHELRTPLSVVLLQVSTLLRYYDRISDRERRRMIGEVQAQAHILRELIEDILELSRFDARHSQPDKQWFDLVAHCHEVAASLGPAIQEKELELDLSRCVGLRYIHADMNQIMRVLRNLLGNAVKYTPSAGRIALALSDMEGMLRIDVSDTGIGITPDEQPRVFERFFRSETAAHIAPGTGLGLSITREIVELHGGSIYLTSEPGQGSTFTVLLPVESES